MKIKPIIPVTIVLALLLSLIAYPVASQSQPPTTDDLTTFLESHPLLIGSGAKVLQVTFLGEALVIDLSSALLPEGVYDDGIFIQLGADLDQAFQVNQHFMTTFLIEGQPLEVWGRPLPDFSDRAEPIPDRELQADGPLSGIKIALNAGHGLYWNELYGAWFYQREDFWGIREDTLNAEIMHYVHASLLNFGATVIPLREPDPAAGIGASGYPTWHEGTRQFAIAQGLPSWIWNGGSSNYYSDIRARPYMANYYGADLLIGLHNNGYNGTMTGTETYWDTDNHPRSQALATAVHSHIISSIRSEYDSSWTDRGVKASDNAYAEINYAQMPAILIELAFMDRQYPDNAYLHDEDFKELAGTAITQGICDFFGVTCDTPAIIPPSVVEKPVLVPPYGEGICDSGWYRYLNQRGNNAYLALNVADPSQSQHQALWNPTLPIRGTYRLEVLVPAHDPIFWQCPTLSIPLDTGQAVYTIAHANGTTAVIVNQAADAGKWVDMGVYHFDSKSQAVITLTDYTHETAKTHTVSASALRYTLVGNASLRFHDTKWVRKAWLTDQHDAQAEYIRNFLLLHRSCLAEPVMDADGQEIDFAAVLSEAALNYQVNPRLLLAIMQAETNALSTCPDAEKLSRLMGLSPATTVREQIDAAASRLRVAMDSLETTGFTPGGWSTGVPKLTLDGVTVTPATDAVTLLFDYMPYAGALWRGNLPEEIGVQGIYAALRDYHLDLPLPAGVFYRYTPIFQY